MKPNDMKPTFKWEDPLLFDDQLSEDERIRLRAAAGPRFDDLEIQTLVGFVHVADDTSAIVDAIAGSFGVDRDDAHMAPVTLVGSESEIVDLLELRRERWQMSYVVIPDAALDACAPIVARLTGN